MPVKAPPDPDAKLGIGLMHSTEKKIVPHTPLVVSEKQAAIMVGLGTRTLQKKRLDGTGPAFVQLTERRIGYAIADLQRWISSRSMRSTAEVTVRAQREVAPC